MAFLKSIWKVNSKHQKLSEELALQNAKEQLESDQMDVSEDNDVVTFKLKYLGSTVVEKNTGDSVSTEAVKNIIKTSKAGKKIQRVNVNISVKGISVCDLQGNDILKISIYRISNCSMDPTHKQIFSFISTDENETMECHAFLCSKRKVAETVTLAVAHAFATAFEAWRHQPGVIEAKNNTINTGSTFAQIETLPVVEISKNEEKIDINKLVKEDVLIDFDTDIKPSNDLNFFSKQWVLFEDEPPKTSFGRTDLIMA